MKTSEIHCGVYRGKDGTLRQVVSVGQEIEGGEKHWFVNWYRHPIDSAQHGRSTRRVNFARWAVERVDAPTQKRPQRLTRCGPDGNPHDP